MGFTQIRPVGCSYVRKINHGEYDCILHFRIDLCQKMTKSGYTCEQLIAIQKKYKLSFQPVSICRLVFPCSLLVFVLAFTSCLFTAFIQIADLLVSFFSSNFNKDNLQSQEVEYFIFKHFNYSVFFSRHVDN